jgi:hypothetical protein
MFLMASVRPEVTKMSALAIELPLLSNLTPEMVMISPCFVEIPG